MRSQRRTRVRGASALEFTLVGIPLVFILIATFELSRGMWLYHTLANGVKEGVRYAVVHGKYCGQAFGNNCQVTIGQIAGVIQNAGLGLSSDSLNLTFTDANGSTTNCVLTDCISNSTYNASAWPAGSANAPGQKLKISGTYPFRSAAVMFWPGAGRPAGSPGIVNLSADSRETIQF